MDFGEPDAQRVLLIVAAVLGFALSISIPNRFIKRFTFVAGAASLASAVMLAARDEGFVPIFYRWMQGEEPWLTQVFLDNNRLFSQYFRPLSDLAMLFGIIAGLFTFLALTGVKLFQQIAWLAVIALLAGFVGGLTTLRMISAGFGGYAGHEVFFGRPAPEDIIDGDTIRLGAARLRLAAIDAPEFRQGTAEEWSEFNQPCVKDGALIPCGANARNALIALAGGKRVVCTRMPEGAADRYGRPLVSCAAFGPEGSQVELSLQMASQGFAVLADEAKGLDTAYAARLTTDLNEARRIKNGVWASCMVKPRIWRDDPEARAAFLQRRPRTADLIDPEACGK